LRYRANLRRRRRYELGSADIPWSADRLFLGRGFRWDQRHTQRLFEARLPANRPLLQGGPLAGALAAFVPAAEFGGVGGDPAIHGVEPDESEIWMDLEDRVGHTLVLGTTRVGKTRLAELLIAQDIRRGEVVIVFDPKGDVDLLRRVFAEAERAGRGGEFFMFHLGHPEISARYNPVGSFSRITEVATRIAGQLPSEGQSAAFKEFVWRFVNVMARALVALGRKPDYQEINRYASDVEPLLIDYFEYWLDREPSASGWREELRSLAIDKKNLDKGLQSRGARAVSLVEYARRKKLYDPIAHALASTLNYEKSHFDKLVASLLPLMEKLTTGRTASLLSPELDDPTDWRPVFDWTSVIHLGGIVYVGLDALSDYEVAAAVGNSMFADLTSVAGSLYKFGTGRGLPGEVKPRRIAIHADEFNELIGDEFIPLLNKAGGAGFQVTAYTQTWSDVEARIGSPAKAGADRRQLQHADHAAGEGGGDGRAADQPAARSARRLDRRVVVGLRHQRPDRLRGLRQPQRGPHRAGDGSDARTDRPGATAQGRGLRADPRRPAAQDPHAAALGSERSADADEPGGDREDAESAARRTVESAGNWLRGGGAACRLGTRRFTTGRWRACC
jgi:conjugative coupling factor TraD (TOL family)